MDQISGAAPTSRYSVLQYDGRLGQLYRIFLVNLLLSIITLGIYRFWAITRWRRYFWSHMRFQNERFEYTGRGGELFLGFLMAIGILLGLAVVAGLLAVGLGLIYPPLAVAPIFAVYVIIFILAFAARFSAQRYRLSRTLWCGIRGGMQGSALAYGARAVLYSVLLLFTLFQMVPWVQIRLAERRINASRLGSAAFRFRGRARTIYLAYLATLVGTILLFCVIAGLVWAAIGPGLMPVLGSGHADDPRLDAALRHAIPFVFVGLVAYGVGVALIGCWYSALFLRHIAGNSQLETIAFSSTITGRRLLWLVLSNSLIILCTLGLGLPIAMHRIAHLLARNLQATGVLDVEALHQSTLAMPRTGEGMLQMLDHGAML